MQGPDENALTTGGKLDSLPSSAIPGVTYEAYAVPLEEEVGSNAWQAEIAGISVADATTKVGVDLKLIHSGLTGPEGSLRWENVSRGLYLIRETGTPEGVVASRDFLIAVPMTDPGNPSQWLDEIYVYPKSAKVSAEMTVENATDYSVGNTVTWTINADIPQIRDTATNDFLPTDRFAIEVPLTDAELLIEDKDSVLIDGLTAETHYEVELDKTASPGITTVWVTLTEDGRAKLVELLDEGQQKIDVTIDTRVSTVGEFNPGATIYVGDTNNESQADNTYAKVSYGNIKLKKSSTDENAAVNGAEFRVYLTKDAAAARSSEEWTSAKPMGYLKTLEQSDGLWVTDEQGEVTIGGLRYSNLADGAAVGEAPGMEYWLAEVKAPEGQQLLAEPVNFTIDSFGGEKTIDVNNTANTNAFVLPLTGGTGTALLTMLGLGILAIVVFVARARRNADA